MSPVPNNPNSGEIPLPKQKKTTQPATAQTPVTTTQPQQPAPTTTQTAAGKPKIDPREYALQYVNRGINLPDDVDFGATLTSLRTASGQSPAAGGTYWENPQRIAQYHLALRAMPPGFRTPAYLDRDALEQAYNLIGTRPNNRGKNWTDWTFDDADSATQEIRSYVSSMLTPPRERVPDYEKPLATWSMNEIMAQESGWLPLSNSDVNRMPQEFQDAIRTAQGQQETYYLPPETIQNIAQVYDISQLPTVASAMQQIGTTTTTTATTANTYGIPQETWDQLPVYQKALIQAQNATLFGLDVSGAASGALQMAPFALPSLLTGNVAGAISTVGMGAGIGAATASDIDIVSQAADTFMKIINAPAEFVERFTGVLSQLGAAAASDLLKSDYGQETYGTFMEVLQNLPAAWKAAGFSYEGAAVNITGGQTEYLGQVGQVQAEHGGDQLETIADIRRRIADVMDGKSSESVDDILAEYQDPTNGFGLYGMAGDMLLQTLADPLNFVSLGVSTAGEKIAAKIGGRAGELAAQAFRAQRYAGTANGLFNRIGEAAGEPVRAWNEAAAQGQGLRGRIEAATLGLHETGGPVQALRYYQNSLRTLPDAELMQMGGLNQWLAGVIQENGTLTQTGMAKTRDYALPGVAVDRSKNPARVLSWLSRMAPDAQATIATRQFHDNLTHDLLSMPIDQAANLVDKIARMSPSDAAGAGYAVLSNGMSGVVPLALRGVTNDLRRMMDTSWRVPEADRSILRNLADTLGISMIDALKKLDENPQGVLDQFRAAIDGTPEGAKLTKSLSKLKGEDLRARMANFLDGTFPATEEEMRLRMVNRVTAGMEKFLIDYLGVKPQNPIYRVANTIKKIQSILLLGPNPSFLVNNVVNNTVTMGAGGLLGLLNKQERNAVWRDLIGQSPIRRGEGFSGMTEVELSEKLEKRLKNVAGDYIPGQIVKEKTRKPGLLASLDDWADAKMRNPLLSFAMQWSGKCESWASDMAYTRGMMRSYQQLNREGVGFDQMPAEIEQILSQMGIDPQYVYSAVRKGKNLEGIIGILNSGETRTNLDGLMTAEERQTLIDSGVLEPLRRRLERAKTPQQRMNAFNDALLDAQRKIEQAGIESIRARHYDKAKALAQVEGLPGVTAMMDSTAAWFADLRLEQMGATDTIYKNIEGMNTTEARAYKAAEFKRLDNQWRLNYEQYRARIAGILEAMGVKLDGEPMEAGDLAGTLMALGEHWADFYDTRGVLADLIFRSEDNLASLADFNRKIQEILGPSAPTLSVFNRDEAWALHRQAMNEKYAQNIEIERTLQNDLDNVFAERLATEFPGREAEAREWRRNIQLARDLETGAQLYFRRADATRLNELGDLGNRVRREIDIITGGRSIESMWGDPEYDAAWKLFKTRVMQKLVLQKLVQENRGWSIVNSMGVRVQQPSQASVAQAVKEQPAKKATAAAQEPQREQTTQATRFETRRVKEEPAPVATPEQTERNLLAIVRKYLPGIQSLDEVTEDQVGTVLRIRQQLRTDPVAYLRETNERLNTLLPASGTFGQYHREAFYDDLVNVFEYSPAQADRMMAVFDGLAGYYARKTGKQPEEWYRDFIAGSVKGGENPDGLLQFDNPPTVENKWATLAKNHFGVTNNIREAGYILPDGSMLDLSGRHYSSGYQNKNGKYTVIPGNPDYLKNQRNVDHRELPDEFLATGHDHNNGMFRFMHETGAVRIDYGSGLINISGPITTEQARILQVWFSDGVIEVDDASGNQIGYQEFQGAGQRKMRSILSRASDVASGKIKPDSDMLFQVGVEAVNRSMTAEELTGYATALVRQGPEAVRQALSYEDSRRERVRILDAVHQIDARMAESVAQSNRGMLFQASPKVDTPEFRRWFGNSKVVDEQGIPLVVYKGMQSYDDNGSLITSIDSPYLLPDFGGGDKPLKVAGFFGDKETANRFTNDYYAAVYPVYLKMENPYIVDGNDQLGAGHFQFGESGVPLRQALRSGRYDGAIIRNTVDEGTIYIALKPDQIKSVNNSGAFNPNDPNILRQTVRGATEWLDDGRAVIHALEGKNLSTAVHEVGHVWLRSLPGWADEDVAVITDWLRTEYKMDLPDDWVSADVSEYRQAHEKFARAVERYLADGTPPKNASERIKAAFQSFKRWLVAIYRSLTGSEIDIKLSDEMRGLFDKWLSEEPEAPLPGVFDREPTQPGFFETEDLPLMSGTPVRAEDQAFNPKPVTRQDSLIDMRPQMKGAKQANDYLFQDDLPAGLTYAYGADPNNKYSFLFRVVDLDNLIASHTDSLAQNPAFPAELQPRDRSRVASGDQINKIARDLLPSALLDDTKQLDRGPMIVGRDRVVESGNGRVLALRRARAEYPERFQQYADELRSRLGEYGLTEADLQGIQNPVLVRERLSSTDRAAFAAEANNSAAARMSAYEQATQDAGRVDDTALGNLIVGEDQSFEQALQNGDNSKFVRQFIESLPETERGTMMDADGFLSRPGLNRLRDAVFAHVYQGEAGQRLLRDFMESTDPMVANLQKAMYLTLPEIGKAESLVRAGMRDGELSVTADISAAVDVLARLRQQRISVKDYLKQGALFENELTPFQQQILQYFADNGNKPKRLRQLLSGYAQAVLGQQPPDQMALFAEARATKGEILDGAASNLDPDAGGFAAAEAAAPAATGTELVRDLPDNGGQHENAGLDTTAKPAQPAQQQPAQQQPIKQPRQPRRQPAPMVAQAEVGTVDQADGAPLEEAAAQAFVKSVQPAILAVRNRYMNAENTEFSGSLPEKIRSTLRAQFPNSSPDEIEARAVVMERSLKAYLAKAASQKNGMKLTAMRIGEGMRDEALLNYGAKTNADNVLALALPYSYWLTHTLRNWALKAIDRPAMLAAYLRLKDYRDRALYQDGMPTRLKGKVKIDLPFLPDWMGDSVYVDPFKQLFPFETAARPFQEMAEQNNLQTKKALSILQDWASDQSVDLVDVQEAIQNRSGDLWERAWQEAGAQIDGEISNPLDFAFMLSGPSLPVQWAYQTARGTPENIGQLPITRLIQNGTAMLGLGENGTGINIEKPIRSALGLPEQDRYQDYRVDRMLSWMTANGEISANDATRAMLERQGEAYDAAERKVAQYGVPRYWGAPVGLDFFPEPEQELRALRTEYDAAIRAGGEAYRQFFEDHPEYEVQRLAWKDPEERLRGYLRSEIWDRYMNLPDLHRQEMADQLGTVFTDQFLNKETRAYDSISTQTYAMWAQVMGATLPSGTEAPALPIKLADDATAQAYQAMNSEKGRKFPGISQTLSAYYNLSGDAQAAYAQMHPEIDRYYTWRTGYLADHPEVIPYATSEGSELSGLSTDIQQVVYRYRADKAEYYPNIDALQDEYYNLTTTAEKKAFRQEHPELVDYWDWRRQTAAQNPNASPYILSDASLTNAIQGEYYNPDEQVSAVASQISPQTSRQLLGYYYAGESLSSAVRMELQRIWQENGEPTDSLDEFIDWLKPAFGG